MAPALQLPENLTLSVLVHSDIEILADVKLPGPLIDRLYLNEYVSALDA